jgi:hypothetical protein
MLNFIIKPAGQSNATVLPDCLIRLGPGNNDGELAYVLGGLTGLPDKNWIAHVFFIFFIFRICICILAFIRVMFVFRICVRVFPLPCRRI